MSAAARAAPALVLVLAIGGCTGATATKTTATTTTASGHPTPGSALSLDSGSDVGNGRPHVTFDGLMVRRRLAITLRVAPGRSLTAVWQTLDRAAGSHRTTLTPMSASVLDPADLARLAPDAVAALPAGATRATAEALTDPASAGGRAISSEVLSVDVVPVLVHDLRFTVATEHPAALARAIDREGILSDALGTYSTSLGRHELVIAYTGALLSDHLVESVRRGISRQANTTPTHVTVGPRSRAGTGVDLATEPAPAPAPEPALASAGHHHGDALVVVDPAGSPVLLAGAVLMLVQLLGLALVAFVVLRIRRTGRPREPT